MFALIGKKRAAWLLFLFIALAALSACSDSTRDHFKLTGSTMGTFYHITVLEREGLAANQQEFQCSTTCHQSE